MELPRELAAWADLLALFPPEEGTIIGSLLRPVSIAVGPIDPRTLHGDAEPDGYDGLSTRGIHERLVPTEWLLATELPDEFLRRAAMNEQVYFRLRPIEHRASLCSVVLFDAGPDQHGAPRALHVALLILFARRAALANAQFSWGILQDDDLCLRPEVDAGAIRALLDGRSLRSIDKDTRLRWNARLGSAAEDDDLWVVGGSEAHLLPHRAHRILIEEPLDMGPRRLELEIQRRRLRHRLTLELPSPGDCARVLRGPQERINTNTGGLATLPRHAHPHDSIVFSDDGRRIAIRLMDGSVADVMLPAHTKGPGATIRLYEPPVGAWIQAVDFARNRLLPVLVRGSLVDVREFTFSRQLPLPHADRGKAVSRKLYRAYRTSKSSMKSKLWFHVEGTAYSIESMLSCVWRLGFMAGGVFGNDLSVLARNPSGAISRCYWNHGANSHSNWHVQQSILTDNGADAAFLAHDRQSRTLFCATGNRGPSPGYTNEPPPTSVPETSFVEYVAGSVNTHLIRGFIEAPNQADAYSRLEAAGLQNMGIRTSAPTKGRPLPEHRVAISNEPQFWDVFRIAAPADDRASHQPSARITVPAGCLPVGLTAWMPPAFAGQELSEHISLVVLADNGRRVEAHTSAGSAILFEHPEGFIWATVHPEQPLFAGVARAGHGTEVIVHDLKRGFERLRLRAGNAPATTDFRWPPFFVYTNTKNFPLTVCMKPWSDRFTLPPGATFRLHAPSDAPSKADAELSEDCQTLVVHTFVSKGDGYPSDVTIDGRSVLNAQGSPAP